MIDSSPSFGGWCFRAAMHNVKMTQDILGVEVFRAAVIAIGIFTTKSLDLFMFAEIVSTT